MDERQYLTNELLECRAREFALQKALRQSRGWVPGGIGPAPLIKEIDEALEAHDNWKERRIKKALDISGGHAAVGAFELKWYQNRIHPNRAPLNSLPVPDAYGR